ncbi:MAG: class I SAM-dependent methyltransferase [Mesorhizobium sp.]|nr:MAG: class I SAM-dependent methyltransferase [Mesorhizobium sp.]
MDRRHKGHIAQNIFGNFYGSGVDPLSKLKEAMRHILYPAARWVLDLEPNAFQIDRCSQLRYRTLDGIVPADNVTDPLPDEFKNVKLGSRALYKLVSDFNFQTVLDIGCGEGNHATVLANHGKNVTALDYGTSPYYNLRGANFNAVVGDFNTLDFSIQFDAIWASHVLEHQLNPHYFLKKIHNITKENGVVAITVPPLKHIIVGGHVTLWNAGLLLYHLVHAGFNCSNASILQYGYNISVIVKKQTVTGIDYIFDMGDIRSIRKYLPVGLDYRNEELDDPFDGDIHRLNW